jgi:hypothetical protein
MAAYGENLMATDRALRPIGSALVHTTMRLVLVTALAGASGDTTQRGP